MKAVFLKDIRHTKMFISVIKKYGRHSAAYFSAIFLRWDGIKRAEKNQSKTYTQKHEFITEKTCFSEKTQIKHRKILNIEQMGLIAKKVPNINDKHFHMEYRIDEQQFINFNNFITTDNYVKEIKEVKYRRMIVSLTNKFTITTSLYFAELLDALGNSNGKDFFIKTQQIKDRTGISVEAQKISKNALIKAGLISVKKIGRNFSFNIYLEAVEKFDLNYYAELYSKESLAAMEEEEDQDSEIHYDEINECDSQIEDQLMRQTQIDEINECDNQIEDQLMRQTQIDEFLMNNSEEREESLEDEILYEEEREKEEKRKIVSKKIREFHNQISSPKNKPYTIKKEVIARGALAAFAI